MVFSSVGPKTSKKVGNFGKVASSKIIDDVAVLEGTIIMLKLSAGQALRMFENMGEYIIYSLLQGLATLATVSSYILEHTCP